MPSSAPDIEQYLETEAFAIVSDTSSPVPSATASEIPEEIPTDPPAKVKATYSEPSEPYSHSDLAEAPPEAPPADSETAEPLQPYTAPSSVEPKEDAPGLEEESIEGTYTD